MFAGDDLGDIEAFKAVLQLRASGLATLLVCSASAEQRALMDLADVVVDGPEGVLDLLGQFSDDAASIRANDPTRPRLGVQMPGPVYTL